MVYKWQVQVKLGRAARTDAGVHAAGNVVSMKLITVIPGVPDLVARINEELPPEIRLWSIVSASPMTDHVLNADIFPAPRAKFVQRTNVCRFSVSQQRPCINSSLRQTNRTCDSRKYTYFFPSYLMIPPKPGSGLHNTLKEQGAECPSHPFWEDGSALEQNSGPQDDLRRKRAYRITPEQLAALRETAKKFEGSHNFHNFTVGRDFRDRSCQRFLKSIEVRRDVATIGGGGNSLCFAPDPGPCCLRRH